MVDISPENVMAKKRAEKVLDDMPPWQRDQMPVSVRLDIPTPHTYFMREAAPLLSGLGQRIDVIARETRFGEFHQMQMIIDEIRSVNMRLREMHGGTNRNGTYKKRREQ